VQFFRMIIMIGVSVTEFDMKEYYDKLSSIQSNLLKIKAA